MILGYKKNINIQKKSKRISYIINDAPFFVSHRLKLALEVKKSGAEILLIVGKNSNIYREEKALSILKEKKINYLICSFSQGYGNFFKERN